MSICARAEATRPRMSESTHAHPRRGVPTVSGEGPARGSLSADHGGDRRTRRHPGHRVRQCRASPVGTSCMEPPLLWPHRRLHARRRLSKVGHGGAPCRGRFPRTPQGHFSIRIDSSLRVAKDDVSRIVLTRSARLVDCRTDRSWSKSRAHIPGATHLPASAFFREEDGTWRPHGDLRRLASAAGVPLDTRLVVYCSAGVSASCGYLMLKSIGVEHVSVYDASWNEWGSDPATPKEPH